MPDLKLVLSPCITLYVDIELIIRLGGIEDHICRVI